MFSLPFGCFTEADCADRVRLVFVAEDEGVEQGIEPANGNDPDFSLVLRVVINVMRGVEIEVLGPRQRDAMLPDILGIFCGVEGDFHYLIVRTVSLPVY